MDTHDNRFSIERLAKAQRLMTLSFPNGNAPDAPLLVDQMDGTETVSRDFEFSLTLLSSDGGIDPADLMGKLVVVALDRDDLPKRHFSGHVFEFRLLRSENGISFYRMLLRPWLAFHDGGEDHHHFREMSLVEQTREIFCHTCLAVYDMRLTKPADQVTFSCQFGESDHNFLHRQWEKAGWHYWYEHSANGHKLVLADDSLFADAVDGAPELRRRRQGTPGIGDQITDWVPVREAVASKVSLSGFDFKHPTPLRVVRGSLERQGEVPRAEIHRYAGLYPFKNREDAQDQAMRAMETEDCRGIRFEAESTCRQAQPGRHFLLGPEYGADRWRTPDAQREFLILSVTHRIRNNLLNSEGTPASYANAFVCLPRMLPWRPGEGFNSTRPVAGTDTAIVVGPEGEEIYTDKYGRVKVAFHWDRDGNADEKSSCWIRVATPFAGNGFGAISVPRVGTEVVVQYLRGDPDRPLIICQLYNGSHMPPWELPANKTMSGVMSRSTPGGHHSNCNMLRMEDKKGQEEMLLHAERNMRIQTERDEKHTVGHDREKVVENDETTRIKHDRTETVDNNENITVHNDRVERVDRDEKLSIGGNRTEEVAGQENVCIGKNQDLSVEGSRSKSVSKNERDSIGKNWSVHVTRMKTETIGMAYMQNVGMAYVQNVGMGRMENVGLGYSLNVGALMSTVVGTSQTSKIGKNKSVDVGDEFCIRAGKKFSIEVGKTNFVLTEDGSITVTGKTIDITALGGDVTINGRKVWVNTERK